MWPAFPASDYYGASAPSRLFNRRRVYPTSPSGSQAVGAMRDGSRVHCEPIDQLGIQLLPRQPRPGYAADLHRGLPAGTPSRLRSRTSLLFLGARALHPDPYPPDLSRCHAYGAFALVPLVCRLVSLAGPGPSGSTEPSRLCQRCFHPLRRLPDRTALSSYRAAATTRRGGLAPPSVPSASRRTGASWRTTSAPPGRSRRAGSRSRRMQILRWKRAGYGECSWPQSAYSGLAHRRCNSAHEVVGEAAGPARLDAPDDVAAKAARLGLVHGEEPGAVGLAQPLGSRTISSHSRGNLVHRGW
jgi:hypothetical protein